MHLVIDWNWLYHADALLLFVVLLYVLLRIVLGLLGRAVPPL